eukprot:364682-Chlamydomonas_euryale.AAC.21
MELSTAQIKTITINVDQEADLVHVVAIKPGRHTKYQDTSYSSSTLSPEPSQPSRARPVRVPQGM